jgi:calcium permeable stress-gated cation channel
MLSALRYIFITKTESGGQFWRILFNRFIFAMLMSNVIIALMVAAKAGDELRIPMLAAMAPIPFLLAGFKWYCSSKYDAAIHYYNKGQLQTPEAQALPDKKTRHGDSVGVRYGHPALYKPLMTPMVHAKAKDVLAKLYDGRLDQDDAASIAGYSDTYSMKPMAGVNVGKASESAAPFELVTEGQLDFKNFKNRPEFRDEFGGDGEVYGKPTDLVRPDTPGSFIANGHGRSPSRDSERTYTATSEPDADGMTYPTGYHTTPNLRDSSPDRRAFGAGAVNPQSGRADASETNLLRSAAPMGVGAAPAASSSRTSSPVPTPGTGDTSYDYFRTGRK